MDSVQSIRAIGQLDAKPLVINKFRLPSTGAGEGRRSGDCVALGQ